MTSSSLAYYSHSSLFVQVLSPGLSQKDLLFICLVFGQGRTSRTSPHMRAAYAGLERPSSPLHKDSSVHFLRTFYSPDKINVNPDFIKSNFQFFSLFPVRSKAVLHLIFSTFEATTVTIDRGPIILSNRCCFNKRINNNVTVGTQ
jgi:hypothetical protein